MKYLYTLHLSWNTSRLKLYSETTLKISSTFVHVLCYRITKCINLTKHEKSKKKGRFCHFAINFWSPSALVTRCTILKIIPSPQNKTSFSTNRIVSATPNKFYFKSRKFSLEAEELKSSCFYCRLSWQQNTNKRDLSKCNVPWS